MKRSIFVASLTLAFCAGGYADSMPVAGSTSGSYLAGSNNGFGTLSGDTWTFDGNSSLVYDSTGTGFGNPNPLYTPLDINLGSLTLTDNKATGNDQNTEFLAELDLTVAFTTPVGSVLLADPLGLELKNGASGYELALTSLPSNSFTFAGETYTVTIDGLYDSASGGSLIDNASCGTNTNCLYVQTSNSGETVGTAYLRGTVTSSDPPSVPEPESISLMLTALVGVGFSLRQRMS